MKLTVARSLPGWIVTLGVLSCLSTVAFHSVAKADDGALSGVRHRVIVSTDIGGTDPDDVQSMVHLLVYADLFDLEGLVSSPYGPGRKKHILEVIDAYEHDYPHLKSHSDKYPAPDALRAITRQGATDNPGSSGVGDPTEGSQWIIECARRDDPRPLQVLVWGGIEDLAQALHDAPDIVPKLRVYFIGGPNKKWSVDAYNYVEQNHPKLWMIEANATYRGWFVGGNQKGEWGNETFVARHIAGKGALGNLFFQAKPDLKMGDTPSVARLLRGASEVPTQPGWGGRFVPIWDGRKTIFNRLTTESDEAEVFGVTEFVLPLPAGFSASNAANMIFNSGLPASKGVIEEMALRFRFSPRDAKAWSYVIQSDFAGLNGQSGAFTATPPPVERTTKPSLTHPNWWIDDPDPDAAVGVHPGAKSVSQWREAFLGDFAERMDRSKSRLRVIVLTDIENEPDDAMSLVRFLTYCNQWNVEGLVATTSIHQRNKTAAWRIREIVDAYGKVRDNLLVHEPGYPTTNHLLSVLKDGLPEYGMSAVGEGKDSTGSELIINAVEKEDPRPVWVTVWGGPNVLAQALWKMRAARTPAQLENFVSKLRVYTISDQDDSGPWIRRTFTNLFYIASPGFHDLGGYHHATWTGISGDLFHGRFTGADFNLVSNPWLDEHIRTKGPLGKQYPPMDFLMEGDTPSFLHLINNGLGNPERPDWGGWGGRYEFYTPPKRKWQLEAETRPLWADAQDEVLGVDGHWHTGNKETIWRWRQAYQNDFVARMNWSISTNYAGANHPPVATLKHGSELSAKPGERVNLSAEGSTDPDGDTLAYQWFYYGEAGTFTISSGRTGTPFPIEDADKQNAGFTVPTSFGKAGTVHIILAVTDNGTPALTRYQRVIVTVAQ